MTAALDPPLCTDLTPDQRQVLQTIYDVWSKDVRWPRAPYIDNLLDHEHNLDLQQLLPTIPERYLLFNRYSANDAELKLTVAGIACCQGSAGDVQIFMRTLGWCVERERGFRPADPTKEETLSLTADDAKKEWTDAGDEASPRILEKAFALAEVEQIHNGWGRSGQDPATWNLTITRRIRPFRTTQTFDDYLAAKEDLHRQFAAQVPPYVGLTSPFRRRLVTSALAGASATDLLNPPTPFLPTAEEEEEEEEEDDHQRQDDDDDQEPVLRVDGLHELVAGACRTRFKHGHLREGVLAAILAYRDLVKKRSGLSEENDSTLMGKAFGGKPRPALVVADLTTETGRNVQRGMPLLSEGLLAFVRNPLTHNAAEIQPAAAMRMIGLVDMLVRKVEGTPVPAPSVAPGTETPVGAD